MANEITVQCGMSWSKSYLKGTEALATLQVTMSGTHSAGQVQDIGTTKEVLVIPAELATLGYCWAQNVDATNYIELGVVVAGTFYPFQKLKPGEKCLFRFATGITPYAQANTSTAKLKYTILED